MPLPFGFGVASGTGVCAVTQTTAMNNQIATAKKRQIVFARNIDLETFQQGTFGPGAILKMSVADEVPATKNCGVMVKIASKTQPSLFCRLELLFFDSTGPLRITVEPDKFASDDEYDTRPLAATVAEAAGSLLNGDWMVCVL